MSDKTDKIFTEQEKHESYGLLSLSRVSSSQGVPLFASSVRPHNTIRLTISTAKRERSYNRDWIHNEKTLIEVEMSPAQFAEAITTLNIGVGTPVTLRYVAGKKMQECPDMDFRVVTQNELKEEMSELGQKIRKLTQDTKELLKGSGALRKADREKILADIDQLEIEVNSNIPFVHQCFNEAVAKTISEAKSELDATVSHIKTSLGEKALAQLQHDGGVSVPLLEEGRVIEVEEESHNKVMESNDDN